MKAKKSAPQSFARVREAFRPMLATQVEKPFDDPQWLFEVKWDGYRCIAFIQNGKVDLQSRTRHSWNEKFPKIVEILKKLKGEWILDGELVVLDEKGRSRFSLMQNYQRSGKGTLCYYVFDLIYRDRQDLRSLPLIKRKELLEKCMRELASPLIRFSSHVLRDGINYFNAARKMHLEGIMGKNIESEYVAGRSREWVKIKARNEQEVVIGGFTAPRGSRIKFGALLVGVYEGKDLVYVGHVGTGFDEAQLRQVYNKLKPLIQKECPFKNPPKPNAPVTWVKPELVCEVKFAEWTEEHLMRQPVFLGLREDKPAHEVVREVPVADP